MPSMDDTRNLIIDPPSGWKYGFPRPYINKEKIPLNEWLVKNGYPQHEVDIWRNEANPYAAIPCRFWEDRRP